MLFSFKKKEHCFQGITIFTATCIYRLLGHSFSFQGYTDASGLRRY
uniref:Uncharacterized protein n=2 Tax=Triticum urartu TaxID=4572 RepID=A0A8R7P393_TRIUA